MAVDVLVVQELKKKLGQKEVLKGVSFAARTGDLVVITGANGAGKTTLFRVLAGLLPKGGGKIQWNGEDLEPSQVRLGLISHQPMLYADLSVQENLQFFARLYGTNSQERIRELLERVGLWFYRFEPVSVLSRGMQQRLALARALLGNPSLLFYDEPFTSLDAEGREILRGVLKEYQSRTIQLLITHELQHLAGLAFREVRLEEGRAVEVRGDA